MLETFCHVFGETKAEVLAEGISQLLTQLSDDPLAKSCSSRHKAKKCQTKRETMPRGRNKIGSGRDGRFLRVGQDLITIALDGRLWWKLFVPVADNDGLVFTDRHHLKLYRLVFNMSGGLTDNPWSNGKWINNGRVYKDRVVPLEFLATAEGVDKIAVFALIHYDQLEIVCVPISDRVRRYRCAKKEVARSAGQRTLRSTTPNGEEVTQIDALLEDNKL